jgi:ketosteroid isomerase-like protein
MAFPGNRRGITVVLVLAFALVGARNSASESSNDDSQALQENERAWAKAALDGDADRMASYMADDYLELSWEPAAHGAPGHWSATEKRDWVEGVRTRKDVYTAVAVRNLTVHLQGPLAVVTGEYSQKGVSRGKDISGAGIYANTWARRGNRWLVIHSVFP